tara:strand:+ start:52152 stop:53198 length:1047 start_codon:yes stop_codon:yes gene_type:complete
MTLLQRIAGLFAPATISKRVTDSDTARERAEFLLAGATFESSKLLSEFPPQIEHAKKRLLFERSLAGGLSGRVTIERFCAFPLPDRYRPFAPAIEILAREGHFQYVSCGVGDWFMNFAHHDLFSGYGHFMLAQDEVQVAEHPVLACIREMMLSRSDLLRPISAEVRSPTPVLVRGAQRCMELNTRAVYGARFARSTEDTIRQSMAVITPPTLTNILAIEAPISSGNAIYTRGDIQLALDTAYSGFRAVVLNTISAPEGPEPITVNTGNWGCGAYGGNLQLMVSIQLMAACLAGVSKIIFHCGENQTADIAKYRTSLATQFKFRPGVKVQDVLNRLVAAEFPWGKPDGN